MVLSERCGSQDTCIDLDVSKTNTHPNHHSLARSFMIDLDMDASTCLPLDLSHAPFDVITVVLSRMALSDRMTCALVCKAWAEAATAATRSIILEHTVDISCLQRWLEKHGDHLEVLQLHQCGNAALTALPCPRLQDLLLYTPWGDLTIWSRVWSDIADATKLTSVSLSGVKTAAGQADVVSALTALPDLQQLTLSYAQCSGNRRLSDSLLLKQAAQLTALELARVTPEALEHLGLLTKLQHLDIAAAEEWDAAGYPGLQELVALTRLHLSNHVLDLPANISQLTALQQLTVSKATPTALNTLQPLTGLTQLVVTRLTGLSSLSPPLQLTGLKHLELRGCGSVMPMSYLERCTRLHVLDLTTFSFTGPGSLVASTSLQHLRLFDCGFTAADDFDDDDDYEAAHPVSWRQIFPGPGRLPYLASLHLKAAPDLHQADMERLVGTCSNLHVLHLDTIQVLCTPPMAQLSALTSLHLKSVNDGECGALAQLTGLRELRVTGSSEVSRAGLRQLAALEQLTNLGFVRDINPRLVSPDWLKEHLSDRLPGCKYAILNKVRVATYTPGIHTTLGGTGCMVLGCGGYRACGICT